MNINTGLNEINLHSLMVFIKNNIRLIRRYNNNVHMYKEKVVFYQPGTLYNDYLNIFDNKVELVIGGVSDKKYEIVNINYKEIPNIEENMKPIYEQNAYELDNFINILNNIETKITKYYGLKLVELVNKNESILNKKIKIKELQLKRE